MKLVLTKKEINYYKKEYGLTDSDIKKVVDEYSKSIEYASSDRLDDRMYECAYKKGII